MRILIEQSGHDLHNLGDWAMLQITVEHFRRRWPEADIKIMATSAKALEGRFTQEEHVGVAGRNAILERGRLFGRLSKYLPAADRWMWRSQAVRAERMMLTRSRLRNYSYSDATAYTDAVLQADAVVSSGGGFITDEFPFMVEGVCGVLAMAQRHNKPTAMFGQGLGPLLNPALIARAREAFPNLSVLGLREPVASPKVAKELGAPVERTKVTGDDATLLSFREKKAALGDAIGFNVRVTEYSGISEEDLSKLRGELQTIATETKAPFMPVIVGHFKGEDQNSSALLPPNHPVLDLPMNSPSDAISAISNCRLVLTGSYHGAVFALGQGIPVIGVAKSSYYQGKFEGLKALYPEGISVIGMSDLMETGNLSSRIIQLHENASGLRDVILHKSEEISKASAKLYTDFFETFAASK